RTLHNLAVLVTMVVIGLIMMLSSSSFSLALVDTPTLQQLGTVAIPLGRTLQRLRDYDYGIDRVAWSPDGKMLATGGGDKNVRLWDAASRQPVQTLIGHTDFVQSVAWSPDSKMVASASLDNTVLVWDASSGRALRALTGHEGGVEDVAWSPDGTMLASAGADSTVRLWDPLGGQLVRVLQGHAWQ